MEWMKVDYEGHEVEAINFLGGVLVRDPRSFGLAHVPGWEVLFRGDMDAPNFRKQPHRLQAFGLELREKE